MSKLFIYLASPYSSEPVANTGKAIEYSNWLIDQGYNVFVPHLNLLQHMFKPRSYEDWLRLTLEWMERCDCVIRLPGFSAGADLEVKRAEERGMPVCCPMLGDANAHHRVLNWLEDLVESREITRA